MRAKQEMGNYEGKAMMEVVRPKQDVGGVRGSHPTEQQRSSMQGS